MVLNAFLFGLLIVLSVWDIVKKEIPVKLVIVLGIFAGIKLLLSVTDMTVARIVFSCMPGAIYICASYISPENIGLGDGLVLLLAEVGNWPEKVFIALLISMAAAFAFSLLYRVLLLFIDSGSYIPFIPFISMGVIFAEIFI